MADTVPHRLFISFWHICLENLPVGSFTRRRIAPADARAYVEKARLEGRLLGMSSDDLLAPYNKHEHDNHEALRDVLKAHFDITLSLKDFVGEYDFDGDPSYLINPLSGVKVQGQDKLLVITCAYALAEKGRAAPLTLNIDPTSVEFHLIEATDSGGFESKASSAAADLPSKRLPEPVPIAFDELMANWEATLDRVEAGEVFQIIREGQPDLYLVPYHYYEGSAA